MQTYRWLCVAALSIMQMGCLWALTDTATKAEIVAITVDLTSDMRVVQSAPSIALVIASESTQWSGSVTTGSRNPS